MIEKDFEQMHKNERLEAFESSYKKILDHLDKHNFYDSYRLRCLVQELSCELIEADVLYKDEEFSNEKNK